MADKIAEIFAWIMAPDEGADEGIPAASVVLGGELHYMPLLGADLVRLRSLDPQLKAIRERFPNAKMRLCRFALAEEVKSLPPFESVIPETKCPTCGYVVNASVDMTPGEEREPEPHDLTFCRQCSTLLMFTDDMGLRRPDQAEVKAIFADNPGLEDRVGAVAKSMRKVRGDHKRNH